MSSNSLWHTPNPFHNIWSLTVADSVDNTFEPTYLRQQAPLGISQYSPSALYRPPPKMGDQSYGTVLSQGTIVRIKELKGLMNKYPQYEGIIRLAMFNSINGDNMLLDQMLEQLRFL
jgi:hypothetical protein